MSTHNFQATFDLYGVSPKVLGEMSYRAALQLMLAGLHKRKKIIADELHDYPEYERSVELQNSYRKVAKGISLTELRLDEIKL